MDGEKRARRQGPILNRIYSLKDPVTEETRYVGITCRTLESRLYDHIHGAKSDVEDKSYRARWIRKLLRQGLAPTIHLIEETEDRQREVFWIKQCRELGCRLTNTTEGGEGSPGTAYDFMDRAWTSVRQLGHPMSEDTKAAISKALIGKPLSEERRKGLLGLHKGKRKPEGFGEKVSAALKGRPKSESHRQALSASKKAKNLVKQAAFMPAETRAAIIERYRLGGCTTRGLAVEYGTSSTFMGELVRLGREGEVFR